MTFVFMNKMQTNIESCISFLIHYLVDLFENSSCTPHIKLNCYCVLRAILPFKYIKDLNASSYEFKIVMY